MESDVFGLEQLCTPEMETDSFSLNFSQKAGPKVKWMANFSSTEANSHKLYQQSEKTHQLTHNGKRLNISYLMLQD